MIFQYYPQVLHNYDYELNKDMNFSAAHLIPETDAGKCQNMHGHTYVVNVTIGGDKLDHCGFLVDFKTLKDKVHGKYDHSVLNEWHEFYSLTDPMDFPTTENVARTIYESIQKYLDTLNHKPKCLQVIVRETPTSYVIYRPRTQYPSQPNWEVE